jgi:hypothetical protein
MTKYVLLLIGISMGTIAFGQVNNPQFNIQKVKFRLDSLDYSINTASRVELQNQFMNRVVYSSRDYGVKGFGASSQLSFQHNSGFWLNTTGYYWQGTKEKFPKIDIGAGFSTALDERLSASIGYSRSLYFGRSEAELTWAIKDMFSTYWTIDVGFMGISPSFYYLVTKAENTAQFAVTASKYKELPRPFLGGKLIFEPNATLMLSSRDRYYAAQPDKPSGKIVRVINYEAVLPITYKRVGAYSFTSRVHWTLPVNVLSFDGAEENKSFFYYTANLNVLLWHHKGKKK